MRERYRYGKGYKRCAPAMFLTILHFKHHRNRTRRDEWNAFVKKHYGSTDSIPHILFRDWQ